MILSRLHQDVQAVICVNAVFFIQLSLIFVLVRLFLKFLKKIRKILKMRRRYPTTAKMERAGGQVEGQLENQPGEVLGKEDATPYLKTLVSY